VKRYYTDGPFTVWDTGFAFHVAPSEEWLHGHPHINVAVLQGSVRRWSTSNANERQIAARYHVAWAYCLKLNAEVKYRGANPSLGAYVGEGQELP